MVEGIYWIYLIPEKPENYKTLIEDNTYEKRRPLLLVSREDFDSRIVVSAIPMDWQAHDHLWENTLKYVVEGRPSLAVIRKSGTSIFDFRYLVASLEISKVSYHEYEFPQMDVDSIPLDVHDTFLLSPSWREKDIDCYLEKTSHLVTKGQAEVFFFGRSAEGTPMLQAVSNVREYPLIATNAITWLISQFPHEGKGYWAGSFWTTVDVLNTLVHFDVPIDQFKNPILDTIYRKDVSGNYDEVLGATCAMLETYDLFLGRTHPRTQTALAWIQQHVKRKTLFERATAYDVLKRLGIVVPEEDLLSFKNEVIGTFQELKNEFKLYRYGKTLLVCGFVSDALSIALKLESVQDKLTGKWVNVPNTAAIVDFLIELQTQSKTPSSRIDEMVFRAVQYLKYTYTPEKYSWKEDISATAKSLKALRSFESKIQLPIDAVKKAIEAGTLRAKNYIAIQAASELNCRLLGQVSALKEECGKASCDLAEASTRQATLSKSCAGLLIGITVFVVYCVLFLKYLSEKNKLSSVVDTIKQFGSESLLPILSPVVAVGFCALLIYILRKLGKSPPWLEAVAGVFFKIKED